MVWILIAIYLLVKSEFKYNNSFLLLNNVYLFDDLN